MGYWLVNKRSGKPYKSRRAAVKAAVGAVKVVKVTGGYCAFETMTDYQTWKAQR